MLSVKGCNAPDQLRSLTQCRSVTPPKALTRRGIAVVSCCSSSSTSPSSISASRVSNLVVSERTNGSGGVVSNPSSNGSASLLEELRLGSLAEDGLSYKEKFIVRSYEVGINKTATMEAIANLLQEAACNQVQTLGYSTDGMGTSYTMRQLHLIWVTARMHIEVYNYPAWGDMIEIETWFEAGRVGTRRDFVVKDATGTVIGRATSKWVAMNQDTRRLQKVNDKILEEIMSHAPRTPRLAFPEEDNCSLKKIPKLEEPAQYSKLGLKARRADLDMNQHVNNVTYIGWLLESLPQEIIDTHELRKVTLDYRRECQHDDTVDSLTSMELMDNAEAIPELNGTNGSATERKHEEDCCRFLHFVRFSGDGPEVNRGRTEWRRKSTR
ncbi:oleoyl-acyl carrier protein thioesterase 1, chloroplastic-like [Macadamia integrifolia]|uniref:oleoyl-acyl carrier protein thioesterase 1, chloroplastic-like n=1 Tax=Macadamia integrifolia TaxID=60698 RepID=UPI001C4FADDA|nr:oleoyl-acyl carrier protein thioesterase 1, chloroplastic-like [Macadamia integrifolia]